jgi:hypothetical protein
VFSRQSLVNDLPGLDLDIDPPDLSAF